VIMEVSRGSRFLSQDIYPSASDSNMTAGENGSKQRWHMQEISSFYPAFNYPLDICRPKWRVNGLVKTVLSTCSTNTWVAMIIIITILHFILFNSFHLTNTDCHYHATFWRW
jgi:hypothetical protein